MIFHDLTLKTASEFLRLIFICFYLLYRFEAFKKLSVGVDRLLGTALKFEHSQATTIWLWERISKAWSGFGSHQIYQCFLDHIMRFLLRNWWLIVDRAWSSFWRHFLLIFGGHPLVLLSQGFFHQILGIFGWNWHRPIIRWSFDLLGWLRSCTVRSFSRAGSGSVKKLEL